MRALLPFTLLFVAAPALAGAAPLMKATPEAGAEGRIITKGASWNCNGGDCKTMSDASRPNILCERLVKEVGRLASFSVNGRAMDQTALAKCNAKAK